MRVSIRALIAVASLLITGATAAAQQETPKVSLPGAYDEGFLLFRSADSSFAYWLDGRVQIDGAIYRGSDNELASGTDVRRARLGTKVTMYRDWHGEFDVDFAENAVEMKDMWVGYMGFKNSLVKAGNFKEPFGLETLTSSKYITFMERSYIDNLSPDRHLGASFVNWGQYHYVTGGVFGQVAGTPDATGKLGRLCGHGTTGCRAGQHV
jgi:Phosphate-selective porin